MSHPRPGANTVTCAACGREQDSDLPFCIYCGALSAATSDAAGDAPLRDLSGTELAGPATAAHHAPHVTDVENEVEEIETDVEINAEVETEVEIETEATGSAPMTLTERIGVGGMGEVYHADSAVGDVAVKILLPDLLTDTQAVARFQREIAALRAVRHRHVIAILATGATDDGRPYYVMPYLQGVTLGARIESGPPLALSESVGIALALLDGLQAVHDAGLVHRDIKPDNVALNNDGREPMLLDLGIARSVAAHADSQLTRLGELVGTPESMAPEQIVGAPVDARTDIYQMGQLLLHMLLGQQPFAASSTQSWFAAHLLATPIITPASSDSGDSGDSGDPGRTGRRGVGVGVGVPASIARVCLKAMAKHPAARYQTARHMQRALRRAHPLATRGRVAAWVGEVWDLARDWLSPRPRRQRVPDDP